jgi:hypothetical protein
VDTYLSISDREEILKRLVGAEEKAQLAWYYGAQGQAAESIDKWNKIFGGSFPTYG